MAKIITLGRLGMSVTYIASISHRGIARKLKHEQKNERKERGKRNRLPLTPRVGSFVNDSTRWWGRFGRLGLLEWLGYKTTGMTRVIGMNGMTRMTGITRDAWDFQSQCGQSSVGWKVVRFALIERLNLTYTSNVRVKLRISQNRKWADKNTSHGYKIEWNY